MVTILITVPYGYTFDYRDLPTNLVTVLIPWQTEEYLLSYAW